MTTEESRTFKVGDIVEWESQAGGYSKKKRGEVVRVVPPRGDAYEVSDRGLGSRPHESYVVLVKRTKFWPRVKHLRLVEEAS